MNPYNIDIQQIPFQYENINKTLNYNFNNATYLQDLDKIDKNISYNLDKSFPLENLSYHPLNETKNFNHNNNLNFEDSKYFQECEEIKEKRKKLIEVYYSLQDFKKKLLSKEKELNEKEKQLKEFESNLKNNEKILKNNIKNFENYIRNKKNELNSQFSEIDIIQSQKEKELKIREEKILEFFKIYNLKNEIKKLDIENNFNSIDNIDENASTINNNEKNYNTKIFDDFMDNSNNTFNSGNYYKNNYINENNSGRTIFKPEFNLNEINLKQIDYNIDNRINTESCTNQDHIPKIINK